LHVSTVALPQFGEHVFECPFTQIGTVFVQTPVPHVWLPLFRLVHVGAVVFAHVPLVGDWHEASQVVPDEVVEVCSPHSVAAVRQAPFPSQLAAAALTSALR
jgi:hypothetical protein